MQLYYRGVEQLVARRAHNPEVVRFESRLRNQDKRRNGNLLRRFYLHFSLFPKTNTYCIYAIKLLTKLVII